MPLPKSFLKELVESCLFVSDVYNVFFNIVLYDPKARRERYMSMVDPTDRSIIIFRATEWDTDNEGMPDDMHYYPASESYEEASFKKLEVSDAADMILRLASEQSLLPDISQIEYGDPVEE